MCYEDTPPPPSKAGARPGVREALLPLSQQRGPTQGVTGVFLALVFYWHGAGDGRAQLMQCSSSVSVCVWWRGGHKAPKCSPHLPQPLSLLPYPSSQGSTRISWVSRVARSQPRGGRCGCGCPGPGRVKAAQWQRAGGRAARVFLLRHQLLARPGRLSAACSFSLPSSQGRRGHVRWKAPESQGGDGKKGRGALEASLLASAVNSCRGGGGGAGLFSETGVLGGGCVPWGLFFGVTLW